MYTDCTSLITSHQKVSYGLVQSSYHIKIYIQLHCTLFVLPILLLLSACLYVPILPASLTPPPPPPSHPPSFSTIIRIYIIIISKSVLQCIVKLCIIVLLQTTLYIADIFIMIDYNYCAYTILLIQYYYKEEYIYNIIIIIKRM